MPDTSDISEESVAPRQPSGHAAVHIAQRFTFTLLSGLALESIIAPHSRDYGSQFFVLERTLLRLLGPGDEL